MRAPPRRSSGSAGAYRGGGGYYGGYMPITPFGFGFSPFGFGGGGFFQLFLLLALFNFVTSTIAQIGEGMEDMRDNDDDRKGGDGSGDFFD
jgi:uncharacterized membrane protein